MNGGAASLNPEMTDNPTEPSATPTEGEGLEQQPVLHGGDGLGDHVDTQTYVVQGGLADVNAALKSVQFQPLKNYFGTATVDILVDDLGNTGLGGNLTANHTIHIDIASVQDMPVLVGAEPLLTTLENEDIIDFAIGLSESDTELSLSAQIIETPFSPLERVVVRIAEGKKDQYYLNVYVKPVTHGVGRFKLLYGDANQDLEYEISVMVTEVDTPPVIHGPDRIVPDSSSKFNLVVSVDDKDTALNALKVFTFVNSPDIIDASTLVISQEEKAFLISGHLIPGAHGEAFLTVMANDGKTVVTKEILLDVPDINTAPVVEVQKSITLLEDQPVELFVGLEDDKTDVSQLKLTVNGDASPVIDWGQSSVSFSDVGAQLTLIPLPDQSGEGVFTIDVSDGEWVSTASIAYKVMPVNDPPTLAAIEGLSAYSGDTIRLEFELQDRDSPADQIELFVDTEVFLEASHAVISRNESILTYEIELKVSEKGPTGISSFSLLATDGLDESEEQVVNVFIQKAASVPDKIGHDLSQVASNFIDIRPGSGANDDAQPVMKIRSINKITALEATFSLGDSLNSLVAKPNQQPVLDEKGAIVLPIDKSKPYAFWIIKKQ